MTDDIPELVPEKSRPSGLSMVSAVWLVPIAALAVALWVGVSTYANRGPLITISFEDASGVLPNETEVRFRNVPVGLVEGVSFNEDLSRVLLDVRLDNSVAPFVDNEASFWIVAPEVTTSGVTGLDTVLSGVYIEGTWDGQEGVPRVTFEGLEDAPLLTIDQQGTIFELRSRRPQGLPENTPILFKGIQVGRLGPARISVDGQSVFSEAIIYEPHDQLVTTATRFWDASGFSFSIGPNGAEIDFSSLAALISGGITFDTLVSGGQPLRDGLVFEVFPDQSSARNSIFEESDGETVTLSMIFNDNVSGLAVDAPVEWRGVRIGRIVNVTGVVDAVRFGDARVRLLASAQIRPSRFGLGDVSEAEVLDFLEARVVEGLRARLITASIFTGGLKVEFLTVPDAEEATLERAAEPFPVFPVTEGEIADVSATAEGVFERVNALPVEDLLASAIAFLDNATALVATEELRDAPAEILGLLSDAREVVGADELQSLPAEVSAVLADLLAASSDLRAVLQEVREAGAVERVLAAVDQAGSAADAANVALAGIPDLTSRVRVFIDGANDLPLEAFISQATGLAEEARTFVGSEAMGTLPGELSEAVAALSDILSQVAEAETAQTLNATLNDAGEAAAAIEAAALGIPAIVARLDRIAADAEEVELGAIAREIEDILDTAARLFGDASAADLPAALSAALTQTEAVLAEMRAGGLVDSANATLASARSASAAIEAAAADLPVLVARLNAALVQASVTLADFSEDGTVGRETAAALREIERASRAVNDLARAIERRPNSVILGR